MPFLPQEDDQEQSNINVLGQNQNQGQGTEASTSSLPVSTPSSFAQQAAGQQEGRKGRKVDTGSFTNFQDYIKANQSAVPRLGQAVQQSYNKDLAQTQKQAAQKSEQFQRDLQESLSRQQGSQNFATSQLQQAQSGMQLNPQDVQRYRDIATGAESYAPANLNIAPQFNEAQRLQNQARQAQSEQGRVNLLQQTFGGLGNNYTRGQSTLDSLLLGANDAARNQLLQNTQQGAGQLVGSLRDAKELAAKNLAGLYNDQSTFRQGLLDQLSQSRTGLDQDLQNRLTGQQQSLRDERQAFEDLVESGRMDENLDLLRKYIPQEQLDVISGGLQANTARLQDDISRMLAPNSGSLELLANALNEARTGTTPASQLSDVISRLETYANTAPTQAYSPVSDLLNRLNRGTNVNALELFNAMNRTGGTGISTSLTPEQVAQRDTMLRDIFNRGVGQLQERERTPAEVLNDFVNLQRQEGRTDLENLYRQILPEDVKLSDITTQKDVDIQQALAALAGENVIPLQAAQNPLDTSASFDLAQALKLLDPYYNTILR